MSEHQISANVPPPDPDPAAVDLPDEEPNTVPSVILEQDEEQPTPGMTVQTIAFAIGIFIIILLVLLLASGGNINLFRFFGGNDKTQRDPIQPQLGLTTNGGGISTGQGLIISDTSNLTFGELPPYIDDIDPLFRTYWQQNGGLRIFGKPISPLLEQNGRKFQWFERSRLEYWPEYAGTPFVVQPGRVGVEFTEGRDFPKQEFFVNRPGLRYEAVTEHGIRGSFLDFWEQNGGVDTFGYPISDELFEKLPEDGAIHTVQYFERARFELHPNSPDQVQLGLLGTALYGQGSKPDIIDPVRPTAVPLTP